jgi:hypothetical protein
MIDALIGAVIAVVAAGALALLAEVITTVEVSPKESLTEYEKSVLSVVKKAHDHDASLSTRPTEGDLLNWMKSVGNRGS